MKSHLLFTALAVSLLLLLLLTLCERRDEPPPDDALEKTYDKQVSSRGYPYEDDVPL